MAFVVIYYTARKSAYLQYLMKKIFVPLRLNETLNTIRTINVYSTANHKHLTIMTSYC